MKVGVEIVMETRIDRGAFYQSASQVTGQNHVTHVDVNPGLSVLEDDVRILESFANNDAKIAYAVCYVGILFAGYEHDIAEIVEYTRGMAHLDTSRVERGIRCTICVGSLDQWQRATLMGCRSHRLSTARHAFNQVYRMFDDRGLGDLFADYKVQADNNQTFLLERR